MSFFLSVHGNYPVEFLRSFCLVYYHSADKSSLFKKWENNYMKFRELL